MQSGILDDVFVGRRHRRHPVFRITRMRKIGSYERPEGRARVRLRPVFGGRAEGHPKPPILLPLRRLLDHPDEPKEHEQVAELKPNWQKTCWGDRYVLSTDIFLTDIFEVT